MKEILRDKEVLYQIRCFLTELLEASQNSEGLVIIIIPSSYLHEKAHKIFKVPKIIACVFVVDKQCLKKEYLVCKGQDRSSEISLIKVNQSITFLKVYNIHIFIYCKDFN